MKRAKGSGCIFQRGGKWLLTYRCEGKAFTRTLGEGSRGEAEAKAKAFLEVLPSIGVEKTQAKVCGVLLKDVWMKFIKMPRERAQKTVEGYESNWQVFLAWASRQGLTSSLDLQPEHVESFFEALQRRKVEGRLISEDTARRILKVVRRVLKGAGCQAWGELPSSAGVAAKGKREAFSAEDLNAIGKVFEDDSIGCLFKPEMEILHQIGLYTGLRLGDCCLLKWTSVDFNKGLLALKPRKTARYGRVLSIPIVPELEHALSRAEAWKDSSGFVLPNVAKRYEANPGGVSQDYSWLLRQAGIQTDVERKGMRSQVLKSFHSLRHTFVSRLAERGVSPLVIQSMSGHTTMQMVERYSHSGLEAKRKALEGNQATVAQTATVDLQRKLEALKTLLQGKVPDEVLALL